MHEVTVQLSELAAVTYTDPILSKVMKFSQRGWHWGHQGMKSLAQRHVWWPGTVLKSVQHVRPRMHKQWHLSMADSSMATNPHGFLWPHRGLMLLVVTGAHSNWLEVRVLPGMAFQNSWGPQFI